MINSIQKRLALLTAATFITALLVWTILFYNNPVLKNVLTDIHLIFSSTLLGYLFIVIIFKQSVLDFIKVFVRTLFRVWLFIFITFAITKSIDRIGFLLSISFIFGYFEGLLDIDKWLHAGNPFPRLLPCRLPSTRINHGLATIFLMSLVHILCAFAIMLIYLSIY